MEFAEAIQSDSTWQTAKQTLDQAKVRVAAARGYLRGVGAAYDANLNAYEFYNRNGRAYYYPPYYGAYPWVADPSWMVGR